MESIVTLVRKARSYDKNSMESLLIKFDPTINNLLRKLGYDCAKTDLIIFFIKMIYSIQLASTFNLSDGALVNYIKESLCREYYRLNKIYIFNEVEMYNKFSELSDNFKFVEYKTLIYELVNLKIISSKRKCVLLEKYHYNPTNKEISQVRSVK
ncbi:hypothetical protein [uncultured Clostridium sp.]|uniref:hypothetical protein n=1 Tax=uncultured Clostridium sp. TaxID=59620 RepID=UPI00321721CE